MKVILEDGIKGNAVVVLLKSRRILAFEANW